MNENYIITIDGPAGAGKSTIARMLAEKLKFRYIDTGAMYRAMTYKIIKEGLSFNEIPEIEKTAEETELTIDYSGSGMKVFIDGEDVTEKIRDQEVTANTSLVAAIPGVRYKLGRFQRESAAKLKKAVLEGRDMGSIVFPKADTKIYLDASIEERAKRRWLDLKERGEEVDMDELKNNIEKRDNLDASRGLAPLRIPDDAEIIDSTSMSIEQVVEIIYNLIPKDCI